MHRDAREQCDVARARDVTGCIEAVGPDEMRVAQPELPCALVHPADEPRHIAACSRSCERVGRIVRALDERAFEQVVHADPLPGLERYARLADLRGAARDGDHVARFQMLQRHEHRHQLRDACDRDAGVRVVLCEHVACRPVDDVPGARIRRLRRRVRPRREDECGRAT